MLLLELTSSIPGIASTMMSRSQSTRRQAAGAASEFEVGSERTGSLGTVLLVRGSVEHNGLIHVRFDASARFIVVAQKLLSPCVAPFRRAAKMECLL